MQPALSLMLSLPILARLQKEEVILDTPSQVRLDEDLLALSDPFAGAFIGQSLGPVLGGVLSAFLGWRSIFWFLTIFAAVFLIPYVILVPETCRSIVGNGSIPPPALNKTLLQVYQQSKAPNFARIGRAWASSLEAATPIPKSSCYTQDMPRKRSWHTPPLCRNHIRRARNHSHRPSLAISRYLPLQ